MKTQRQPVLRCCRVEYESGGSTVVQLLCHTIPLILIPTAQKNRPEDSHLQLVLMFRADFHCLPNV